jgi:hypothetical protein
MHPSDQVEGPVREVDDLHQPEDQGEAAREQEEQRSEAQPVQRLQRELVK